MKNYQASKHLIVRKSTKIDDILTMFFQNINTVLEKAATFNTTCTTWNMIINSIDLFEGLSHGLQFTGSYISESIICAPHHENLRLTPSCCLAREFEL